jgi:signal transduction histidine kinase
MATLDAAGPGRGDQAPDPAATYAATLGEYLDTHDEAALYRASLLSQALIEAGLGPDEIVAVHFEAVERILAGQPYRQRVHSVSDAYQFLLEVMIAYGVRYRQYTELRLAQLGREAETRLAQEHRRLEEARQLAQEKADLLAVVAHELRTPISAVKGSVDLAVRSVARGRVERVPELLKAAREAVDRLSRLTGNLVEASREQPPELARSPQDLVHLIAQACRWARTAAVAGDVALEWAREPLSVLVWGDQDALLSVLGNLLSNAIRYTPAGGRVTVRHGLLAAPDGGWGWVEVEDTGIGMSPEVQERVFERFYRAPEALQQGRSVGLGLGLALVEQFVGALQGRIELRSALGQGSTFRVLLPAAAPASEPPDGGLSVPVPDGGLSVPVPDGEARLRRRPRAGGRAPKGTTAAGPAGVGAKWTKGG